MLNVREVHTCVVTIGIEWRFGSVDTIDYS